MAQNDEIILININGADRPGVTAALTEILSQEQRCYPRYRSSGYP